MSKNSMQNKIIIIHILCVIFSLELFIITCIMIHDYYINKNHIVEDVKECNVEISEVANDEIVTHYIETIVTTDITTELIEVSETEDESLIDIDLEESNLIIENNSASSRISEPESEVLQTSISELNKSINIENNSSFNFNIQVEDLAFIKEIDGGNDVDDDQLEYLINICNEYGINPYLVCCFIYTESRGQSDADGGDYRGYCQISSVGGEFIYEEYLKLGEYNHDFAYDPYMNLLLATSLLCYLRENECNNMHEVIQYFSGTKNSYSYINRATDILKSTGNISIDDVESQWQQWNNLRNEKENNND